MNRRTLPPLLTLLLLILLAGCSANQSVKGAYPPKLPHFIQGGLVGGAIGSAGSGMSSASSGALGFLGGGLLGASLGSYYDSEGLAKSLREDGVTIFTLGDILEVVIPADLLFRGGEVDIKRSAYPMLAKVSAVLNQYAEENIAVYGYSDDVDTNFSQLDLSGLQAQSVATYLWSRGMDIEKLHFQGLGQTETTASDNTIKGSGYNRRIEISLFAGTPPTPLNTLLIARDGDCWYKNNPTGCRNKKTLF